VLIFAADNFKILLKMKRQNLLLQAALAICLMIGGGVLTALTLGTLSATMGAMPVAALVLVAILLYVIGASWLGRIIARQSCYSHFRNRSNHGAVLALTVIAAGALLLGFNTGALPAEWKSYYFSWPMLLVVIGTMQFCDFNFLTGVTLVAVGKFFLMDKLADIYPHDAVYSQFSATYWPILIIVVGALFFVRFLIYPKGFRTLHNHGFFIPPPPPLPDLSGFDRREPDAAPTTDNNNDGIIDYSFIFSGQEQVYLEPEFKGGRIETVFGGMTLDLRRTALPEGETRLELNSVFGGVVLIVPTEWYVETVHHGIFGGISDSRPQAIDMDKSRKLVIIANNVCGGVEIKN
jgi:predicted membrane protein